MKLSFLNFIMFSVLITGGCIPQKETTREKVIEQRVDYPLPPPPVVEPAGPSDGGGGAGIGGKPIESYQVNFRNREEFVKNLEPILKNLAQTFPRFAADLLHVLDERTWYLIPGPLKKLPAEAMGLGSFVDFDQLAFQNLNDIWVDSKPYDQQMNESDRALLILHEMIVGVRLLEFSDALDICLAEAKIFLLDPSTFGKYRDARKHCFTSYPRLKPHKPKLEIPTEEYSSIRSLVVELSENQGVVDAELMKAWLFSNGFKTYK